MRNVVVTGASRGLGLGIARRLASDGFRVVAIARNPSAPLDAAIAEAGAGPGAIAFTAFDLGDLDNMADLAKRLRTQFGPLYGLVNNAGIGAEALLTTMSIAAIERVVRLNTTSPMVLTRSVARSMLARNEGRIVNMSSIVATTGYNALSVYAATKASMIGFTHSLARELGRVNVTVNAVAPGFVDTEMTQSLGEADRARIARRAALGRLAGVDDVAAAVGFLMSDAAANITGTVMTVDAGGTA